MSKINDGGPAFPAVKGEEDHRGDCFPSGSEGMSLRQWYAGLAMQSIAALFAAETKLPKNDAGERLAKSAFAIADCMIAAENGP